MEALCELLLGMKSPGTRAARPIVSQETGSRRRPIPLTTWMWLRRLAAALISLALAASLFDVIWPKTVSEPEAPLRSLVWVDRAGYEEPIEVGVRRFANPRLSPDNVLLLVEVEDDDHDLWFYNLAPVGDDLRAALGELELPAHQRLLRLTADPAEDLSPLWTRDGVVFAAARDGGVLNLFRQRVGPDQTERLTTSSNPQMPGSLSLQGLVFEERDPDGHWDRRVLSLDGQHRGEPLLASASNERQPALSPDGQWLAYASDDSAQSEVYVRPFPNVNDALMRVSINGGRAPLWGPDGMELFYRQGKSVMVAAVASTPSFRTPDGEASAKKQEHFNLPTVSRPQVLFGPVYYAGEGRSYDISTDGRRLVMIKE